MKHFIWGLLLITASAASFALAWSLRGPRLGYVETNVLMAEFEGAQDLQRRFDALQTAWNDSIAARNQALQDLAASLQNRYPRALAAERKRIDADLKRRNEEIKRYAEGL